MSDNSYVVFRVDGDALIGLGHIMRCLTLADLLSNKGFKILFICTDPRDSIVDLIESKQYELKVIKYHLTIHKEDTYECLKIIDGFDVSMLIVDHYQLDEEWEIECSKKVNKVMVIDDLANRKHYCDYLLDSSYGRINADYEHLTHSDCRLLLSTDYCLLRPEFHQLRNEAVIIRKNTHVINSVLLNFGGTDHKNLSAFTIRRLVELQFFGEIHLLISSVSEHIGELEKLTKNMKNIWLHIDEKNVAQLMLNTNLAIGSVGTSSWERCCLGLPSIGLVVASNQSNIATRLSQQGAMLLTDTESLKDDLNLVLSDRALNKWHQMSESAFATCDGLGGARVLNNIMDAPAAITLQAMSVNEEALLLTWQSEAGNRKYSRNTHTPNIDEHKLWFAASLMNPKRRMWLVIFEGQKCGYVRLDVLNTREEVSVLISQQFRKLGLAYAAINELKTLILYGVMGAEVSPDNKASCSLFNKLGFTRVSTSRYQWVDS